MDKRFSRSTKRTENSFGNREVINQLTLRLFLRPFTAFGKLFSSRKTVWFRRKQRPEKFRGSIRSLSKPPRQAIRLFGMTSFIVPRATASAAARAKFQKMATHFPRR